MAKDYLRSTERDRNLEFAHCTCAGKDQDVQTTLDPTLQTFPHCTCGRRKHVRPLKIRTNHQPCTYPFICEERELNRAELLRTCGPTAVVEHRPRYIPARPTYNPPILSSFRSILTQFVVPIINFNNAIRWGCPPRKPIVPAAAMEIVGDSVPAFRSMKIHNGKSGIDLKQSSSSNLLSATDTLYCHLERIYGRIWCRFSQFAWGNFFWELYATLIDIILILYAFGFIVISLYETAVIA